MTSLPAHHQHFPVVFNNGHTARAVRVTKESSAQATLELLGFARPYPVIFVSGGASNMTEEDQAIVKSIIHEITIFAEERRAVIIDGGTESGIMKMVGDTRGDQGYRFPLLGVSPLGKISFPGYKNPGEEAFLEDSHSHFVLVDGEEWGDESATIVALTNALSGEGRRPSTGILINGGNIAMKDVYLATTTRNKVPMIILEGSGRAADEISSAFRTGRTDRKIVRAILDGGDISLVSTKAGPAGMRETLEQKFVEV